jgi:hypothetical protein
VLANEAFDGGLLRDGWNVERGPDENENNDGDRRLSSVRPLAGHYVTN